ncbi:MAG: xylose isomerase [Dehalococcoidia bacterium]|jgi:xylose isomerase|nr:xylose isomerase [Dehalococcoidia bacterium]
MTAGDEFTPTKADKFTFGLWTVGNQGRDPFGSEVRGQITPERIVQKLSELGAYGVNLHDNDLIPIDATPAQRDQIVRDFRRALAEHDMKVPMVTTNLFSHPVFKDGAFTSNDPQVRAFAIQKVMRAIDLGVELGAGIFVFWGGREGTEVDASKDPQEAIRRFREAINYLSEYVVDQGYELLFALEAKPNEPRGDIFFPTTGHLLHFIETLDRPDVVGVNPEVAHEHMAGLNFHHGVAQALEAGKLFHIDLNDQKPGRYDQDLRFASESIKGMFFLVKLLEEGDYQGPRHFDAHAYRTEDEDGVWDFALGCMRTYNILKAKVRRFQEDKDIQGLLAEIRHDSGPAKELLGTYSSEQAARLKTLTFDIEAMARPGLRYEKLDQLLIELLLGVR